MSAVIEAAGLSLGYGRSAVLEGVDFRVEEGEFWFLVGPNGAGKSTFLRAVAGMLRPLAGALRVSRELAGAKRSGYVPQRSELNRAVPTTVREFVLLGLVGTRARRSERPRRLAWALEKLGLGGMELRDYWSLSGGQRQRALVARALVRRPRLLFLDEPTAGLDLPAAEHLLRSLASLHREEGMTVLFVTHDLAAALRHGTHLALFGAGGVVAGPARRVLTPENLTRAYGPSVRVVGDPAAPAGLRVETAALPGIPS